MPKGMAQRSVWETVSVSLGPVLTLHAETRKYKQPLNGTKMSQQDHLDAPVPLTKSKAKQAYFLKVVFLNQKVHTRRHQDTGYVMTK